MDIVAWFATLSPEGQLLVIGIGGYFVREIMPFFWRFMNRQQVITDKALENASDTASSNAQLIKLLTETLGSISKSTLELSETNKRLEHLLQRNQDVLARVDETTQSTRRELRDANFSERLRHIEDLQAKHSRLLIEIYKQNGGIIPAKGTP